AEGFQQTAGSEAHSLIRSAGHNKQGQLFSCPCFIGVCRARRSSWEDKGTVLLSFLKDKRTVPLSSQDCESGNLSAARKQGETLSPVSYSYRKNWKYISPGL
ncbi:MAG: hypothetical protein IIY55_05840, partial [Blautia sp.]|nr:hypothetical protein [Blautia sp.]